MCLAPALAADFPQRAVRFVVGYAPGGGADILARVIARELSTRWQQPVVVENRPGGGGTIAANLVAHAAADGYTMLLITTNHAVPSQENRDPGYHPLKSFAPVTEVAYIPSALLVAASVPVASVREMIVFARGRPGQLNFGSTGTASAQFMDMQMLMQRAGIKMTNVTYKGASPILVALLGNEIQFSLQPITAFLETIKNGKLKALAVSGRVRAPLLPGVPTFLESGGLDGFEGSANWYGVLMPAHTPGGVVRRLHDDIVAAVKSSEVQRLLSEQAYVTVAGTPDEFARRIANETARWSSLSQGMEVR